MATMKRKPSQEDDIELAEEAVPTDEVVDTSAMDLIGEDQSKDTKPSAADSSSRDAQTIARMVAGATPTLFGMLFGPQQAERGIAQTQKFFAAGKPSKLVPIVGPDGAPIYETPEAAIGERVYQKPAAKAASGSGQKEKTYIVDGKAVYARALPSGDVVEYGTNRPLNEDIASGKAIPAEETTRTQTVEDIYGTKKEVTTPKFGDKPSERVLSSGYGAKYGLPEQDIKQGEKVVSDFTQASKPIHESKSALKGAIRLLNAPASESIKQAAGVFRTAKAIVNERISDQERAVVTLPPGMLQKLSDKIDTAMTNKNPESTIVQLKSILVELDDVNNMALADMQNRYQQSYAAGDPKKAKFFRERAISAPSINVSEQPSKAPAVKKQQPKFTKQQWDALPESQKKKIMGIK